MLAKISIASEYFIDRMYYATRCNIAKLNNIETCTFVTCMHTYAYRQIVFNCFFLPT